MPDPPLSNLLSKLMPRTGKPNLLETFHAFKFGQSYNLSEALMALTEFVGEPGLRDSSDIKLWLIRLAQEARKMEEG